MPEKERTNKKHTTPIVQSKGQLAIILSKIKGFNEAKVSLEQYQTDSEVAASVLWNAFLSGDLQNKKIVDLGSGTGILGLGTMLLGASELVFVEIDKTASETCKNNFSALKSECSGDFLASFRTEDVSDTTGVFDVAIMNPPFGTKKEHADRVFLQKAIELAPVVYSFHKASTFGFVQAFAKDNGFKITHHWQFLFPLKQTMKHHTKKIQRINVVCVRLEKQRNSNHC
ncbi:MAG: METTL5 family protein [Candidatus Woesearchaeota archaeon]|nr:METTL5 family protein [Candidatus Woesearchaeota archaeon]